MAKSKSTKAKAAKVESVNGEPVEGLVVMTDAEAAEAEKTAAETGEPILDAEVSETDAPEAEGEEGQAEEGAEGGEPASDVDPETGEKADPADAADLGVDSEDVDDEEPKEPFGDDDLDLGVEGAGEEHNSKPAPAVVAAVRESDESAEAVEEALTREVALRTADENTKHADVFTVDLVVLKSEFSPEGYDHAASFTGVRQRAVQQGLHPVGDAYFEGSHRHPDGKSVILRYELPVLPADSVVDEGTTTVPQA